MELPSRLVAQPASCLLPPFSFFKHFYLLYIRALNLTRPCANGNNAAFPSRQLEWPTKELYTADLQPAERAACADLRSGIESQDDDGIASDPDALSEDSEESARG